MKEVGGWILCRDLNEVMGSGEKGLGRGNSKQKARPLMEAELGMVEEQEGGQCGWP